MIDDIHPAITKWIGRNKLATNDIISDVEINLISVNDLIEKYDVEEVGTLKIDTEGHDHKIVCAWAEAIKAGACSPAMIIFEANALSDPEHTRTAIRSLIDVGYRVDTRDRLNVSMIFEAPSSESD